MTISLAFLSPDLVKRLLRADSLVAWGLRASPICPRNGRVSTKCSAFPRSNPHIGTKSLPWTVSVSGKQDFATRDKTVETAAKFS